MISVANYTVESLIHEGPLSAVYRGYRNADNVPVVFKLPRSLPADATEVPRIKHEAKVLSLLQDVPGVAHALNMDTTSDGVPVLIIEYVAGRQLDDWIARVKTETGSAFGLPVVDVLHIGLALVDILSQVHERLIVHKDIKPHNIILESIDSHRGAKLRLLDFGIAALLGQEVPDVLDPASSQEGTPHYLPPEQTGRINRIIDYRSDYYALGATLYHLLTGQVLFPGDGPHDVLVAQIGRQPTPPAELRIHGKRLNVPSVLSQLVMKLLSKVAEERYQSAKGLRADLRRCLRDYQEKGTIAPFELGQQDRSRKLRPPQRLYGRDTENGVLWESWGKSQKGAVEVVLITGPGGVGKSALVQELLWALPAVGGKFAASKFDQLGARTPYEGIRRVMVSLVRQTLALPRSEHRAVQRRLTTALGGAGRVLSDVAPELELLIGPQPDVPSLDGQQAHNRFSLLVCEFLRVMTSPEHPLLLFFDDLQWADASSLRTLQQVISDPLLSHLLVVAAYRDSEITEDHPLPPMLEAIRRAGITATSLALGPLSFPDSQQFVADALSCAAEDAKELAQLAHKKTGGNPFFLGQFLRSAYQRGVLYFSEEQDCWKFDLSVIDRTTVSNSILEFVLERLRELPEETQRALAVAAIIGFEFHHPDLAALLGQAPTETSAALRFAIVEELIFPSKRGYQYIGSAKTPPSRDNAEDVDHTIDIPSLEVSYRFQHDRVQQAAYSLVPEDERALLHLHIGRHLNFSRTLAKDEQIFEVVRHLNLGSSQMDDQNERWRLAELNVEAARRAKSKTAYAMAVELLRKSLALCGDDKRRMHGDFWFHAMLEQADCLQRNGQYGDAQSVLGQLESATETRIERAQLGIVRIETLQAMGQFRESVAAGLTALQMLGAIIPETDPDIEREMQAEMAWISEQLASRPLSDLTKTAELKDPEKLLELELLLRLDTPSFAVNRALSALVTAKEVSLSLRHGSARGSVVGYMAMAMLLARLRGQYQEAVQLGELALSINTRYRSLEFEARLRYLFGSLLPFARPLREAISEQQRAFEVGSAFGDMQGYFASLFYIFLSILQGDPADRLGTECDRICRLIARTNNNLAMTLSRIGRQTVRALLGKTRDPLSLTDDTFDESVELGPERLKAIPTGRLWYYLAKLYLKLLLGSDAQRADCWQYADMAVESAPAAAGLYIVAEYSFLYCFAGLCSASAGDPSAVPHILARIAPHREKISQWADSCPANFAAKKWILTAEEQRLHGQIASATASYQQAIAHAMSGQFPMYAALSAERCATMLLAQKEDPASCEKGAAFLKDAVQRYKDWNALGKVTMLQSEFAALLV